MEKLMAGVPLGFDRSPGGTSLAITIVFGHLEERGGLWLLNFTLNSTPRRRTPLHCGGGGGGATSEVVFSSSTSTIRIRHPACRNCQKSRREGLGLGYDLDWEFARAMVDAKSGTLSTSKSQATSSRNSQAQGLILEEEEEEEEIENQLRSLVLLSQSHILVGLGIGKWIGCH
ncbi:hypothetical protein BDZ45DRAFT_695744 [Acephala macrosclerotiorum]|nr:hypothetical protein BDZ45DRAFT_695744 [Acephala macrosclerotiorum]